MGYQTIGKGCEMKRSGFTLIELMVVVIIVGILAAVGVPMMSAMKSKAISSEVLAALGSVETAAENYFVEHGAVVPGFDALADAGVVRLADLDGTYFAATDIEGMLGDGKLPFVERGLGEGAGTAKGVTITKGADGQYTVSGTYDPDA